jgi:Tfp pilus assembly protein PilO
MSSIKLQYLYWFIANNLKKLGAWGIIGLCIIIASLLFYASKIPKIEILIKETQSAIEEANSALNSKNFAVDASAPLNNSEEINRFYDIFPKAVALPQALTIIYQTANKQKLALNSGDYKFNKIKETNNAINEKKLTKYEIVLPIKGQYKQIRAFISDVLLALPALALTDMQIRRENSLNQNVEARLIFVIFVKGESW